jgi:MYXO-CTERM domain-containing protein
MSSTSVFSPPGSANQSVLLGYTAGDNGSGTAVAFLQTVTFSAGVNDLALYFRFWRGGDSGGTPVPNEYQLRAYDSGNNLLSYSFLSGDYTTAPTITNNTFELSVFTSGIIAFTGAVSKVEWTVTNPAIGGGNAFTTFAILPSAVPGSGLAAVGSLGLAGLARRRRRH